MYRLEASTLHLGPSPRDEFEGWRPMALYSGASLRAPVPKAEAAARSKEGYDEGGAN